VKTEEARAKASALNELGVSCTDLAQALRGIASNAKATKNLWQSGKRPVLIKVGLALIAFPDPTISDVIGTGLVVAGLVQEGIRRRALHMEDVSRTFQSALKDLRNAKSSL